MLKIRNLTKRYGRYTALDSLDLQIDRGEIFGFVGPNGGCCCVIGIRPWDQTNQTSCRF